MCVRLFRFDYIVTYTLPKYRNFIFNVQKFICRIHLCTCRHRCACQWTGFLIKSANQSFICFRFYNRAVLEKKHIFVALSDPQKLGREKIWKLSKYRLISGFILPSNFLDSLFFLIRPYQPIQIKPLSGILFQI